MEIKKGGIFKTFWFLSSNIVGIFTVVCGSFWHVDKIQMALPWKPRYQNNGVWWCPLLLCNDNSSYYYYCSSSSSRRELVRPISQRLMIRSLLNFTGRWIPISRSAIRSWNFQNGRRCHGNHERMSKSLTPLISETAKGISTKLGIYIKEGW
jgi:hypothetical protein